MKLRFIFLVLVENQLEVKSKKKYITKAFSIVKYLKMKLICLQRCNIVFYFKLNTIELFYDYIVVIN